MRQHSMCQHSHGSTGKRGDGEDRLWTVNDILRQFGPDYLKKYGDRMSLDQTRVLKALRQCRTAEAGSILFYCPQCTRVHHVPKACGNRHCPGCQGDKARSWLEEQQARLLPCAYFMLTFTVPAEFRPFMRSHPRQCYQALMQAAYQALTTLAKDPHYLGSDKLGATAVLHTWGRDLNYHPHVHMIVPGGAISPAGTQWTSSRVDYLVPVLALSKIFRAKFKQLMQQCGLLERIEPVVWQKAWNVNCQAVGDGRQSLRYLAPYVFRVAVGNHRIRRVELSEDGGGWVTFLVKPSKQPIYRPIVVNSPALSSGLFGDSYPERAEQFSPGQGDASGTSITVALGDHFTTCDKS